MAEVTKDNEGKTGVYDTKRAAEVVNNFKTTDRVKIVDELVAQDGGTPEVKKIGEAVKDFINTNKALVINFGMDKREFMKTENNAVKSEFLDNIAPNFKKALNEHLEKHGINSVEDRQHAYEMVIFADDTAIKRLNPEKATSSNISAPLPELARQQSAPNLSV